jgi:hypothetical protein
VPTSRQETAKGALCCVDTRFPFLLVKPTERSPGMNKLYWYPYLIDEYHNSLSVIVSAESAEEAKVKIWNKLSTDNWFRQDLDLLKRELEEYHPIEIDLSKEDFFQYMQVFR